MLLKIETDSPDLSYLMHKHPDKYQVFDIGVGDAKVFFPEYGPENYSFCLLVDVDPLGLAKAGRFLTDYVNDRPYASASFLAVGINKTLKSAMNGTCKERDPKTPMNLKASIPCIKVWGKTPELIQEYVCGLFEPLGYEVEIQTHELKKGRGFEETCHHALTLKYHGTLSEMLNHLYVLLPVLDGQKHHKPTTEDVKKLVRRGSWIASHPARKTIVSKFVGRNKSLFSLATKLIPDWKPEPEEEERNKDLESTIEVVTSGEKIGLHQLRHGFVLGELRRLGCRSIIDMGCNTGRFLQELLKDDLFTDIVGVEPTHRSLEQASRWCHLSKNSDRLKLYQGSVTYRDKRLMAFDAIVLIEVLEHIHPERLSAAEQVVFKYSQPKNVIVTMPNREYNEVWEGIGRDKLRHHDHKFEFTRQEFLNWALKVAAEYHYDFVVSGIGEEHPDFGFPSQAVVFTREQI